MKTTLSTLMRLTQALAVLFLVMSITPAMAAQAGSSNKGSPITSVSLSLPNACMIEAVMNHEILRKNVATLQKSTWHRLLVVDYWNNKMVLSSHAMLVMRDPTQMGVYWVCDKSGTRSVTVATPTARALAAELYKHPVEAFFAEDLPRLMASR